LELKIHFLTHTSFFVGEFGESPTKLCSRFERNFYFNPILFFRRYRSRGTLLRRRSSDANSPRKKSD